MPETWQTVGHLYRGIEAGLADLCDRHGDANVFIGPRDAQATTEIFEWPELIAVTDLASARKAIHLIVEQGEGARGDWVDSHFGRFVGILEDFRNLRASDPSFEPALPVEPAHVRLPPDVDTGHLIDGPLTARVMDLFNGFYEVTLQALTRYFVHHGETADELDTLARTTKHLMNWVMRILGPTLATLPINSFNPKSTAGVTFDIARPASFFLPHRDSAWRIIEARLLTLAKRCESLSTASDPDTLEDLSTKVRIMARELRAHLEDEHPQLGRTGRNAANRPVTRVRTTDLRHEPSYAPSSMAMASALKYPGVERDSYEERLLLRRAADRQRPRSIKPWIDPIRGLCVECFSLSFGLSV